MQSIAIYNTAQSQSIFYLFPDEIAGVQQATVQFIEDAAANDDEDFRYVLVPFNDPGEPY
jgi:hypothetical protein